MQAVIIVSLAVLALASAFPAEPDYNYNYKPRDDGRMPFQGRFLGKTFVLFDLV